MSMEEENFFEIQKWRQLRDSCKSFNEQEELKIVQNAQKSLVLFDKLCDDQIFQNLTNEQKDFFTNTFTLQFIKDLLNHTQYQKDNYDTIEQIIFKSLKLIIKFLPKDIPQLSEAFKQIFDLTRIIYKNNNQDENEKRFLGFEFIPDEKRKEWIQSLKQGDLIDAVKQEKGYKKSCWSRAQILYILDNYNEVKLGFLNEYERNDCYINLISFDIAELGSMTDDYEWRQNLKKGDLLDVCDTTNVWYNSTVLDRKKRVGERGDDIIEIKIGYRVYNAAGSSLDENQQPYIGWSERYDDWFTITSPRIQKFNKMAKKFSKLASQSGSEEFLDDSMDIIYEKLYQERSLCGIIRHYLPLVEIPTKSVSLIKFMNFFLENKGFEGIIQRINDRDNWLSFEILANYMHALGGLNRVFYRQFCLDFIPRLWDSVKTYMINMPDNILRTVEQNKQDQIFKSLDVLVKRAFSVTEKQELVESLYLQFAQKCFNCDFLQQKILGLKMLTQLLTNIKTNTFRYHTNISIKSWMEDNNIFDSIFTQDSHAQLIQRSVEVLKFMIAQNMISYRSLEIIWQLINSNSSSKEKNQSIFKVLYELSPNFQLFQVEHILKMIEEMETYHIQSEHINLIHELFGSMQVSKNFPYLNRALNSLWQIFTNNQISEQITDKALQQFIYLGKNMESSENKYGFITKCLQNIQNNISVSQSIRIMKQLIESYQNKSSNLTIETQETVVFRICNQYDINKLVLDNIQNLKIQAKLIFNQTQQNNKDFQDYLQKYLIKLEDRINIVKFINSLLQEGQTIVNLDFLSSLWEELVTNQIIQNESDLMFKWLKEFKDSDKNITQIEQFYKEKMLQSDIFIKSLTINGFECFQSLFIMINLSQKKLIQKSINKVQKYFSVYNMSSEDYNQQIKEQDADQNNIFGYQCDVNPKELSGINRIWDFVEIVEDPKVSNYALQFLIKLYQNFTPLMQPQISSMANEYLEKCFSQLNQEYSRIKNLGVTNKKQDFIKIKRILTMIQKFQEESEVNGISGLKSHSGLIKGEQQTIQIINELTTITNQEKKFELKIYSNKTIFDLKIEIAKRIKLSWDSIRLKRFGMDDIQDSDNGKTIGEMRFKNNEILTVLSRQTEFIPHAMLLDQQGNLMEKPKLIFTKWFEKHSLPNGLMDSDFCAKFISSCTNDICKGDDSRVKDVFQQMDDDNDGFLTLQNFLNFYLDACKNRHQTVWKNLQTHGYRNDLKDNDELAQEEVDIQILPRFILMQNQQFYDILFDLINLSQDDGLSLQIWQILQNIPTSSKIQEMIVKLEGIKTQEIPDWSKIFDESLKNKMLYILNIIEYLMEDEDEEELLEKQEAKIILSNEQIERKKNNQDILQNFVIKKTNEWRSDFIFYGGFEQLFKVFQKYVKVEQPTLIEKQILQFILKIIKNYLTATLAHKVKHIYKIANYARLASYSLDVIDQNLKEDDDINFVKLEDHQLIQKDLKEEKPKDQKESKDSKEQKEDKTEEKSSSNFNNAIYVWRQRQKIKETKDFLILSEKLQGELGDKIIQTLNIIQLMNEIIDIILNIIKNNSELESEDRLIIDFGLSIFVTIIMQKDNNCIDNFLKNQNSTQFLISGIFHSQINVRKVFRNSMYLILRQLQSSELYIWLISLFIENLPTEKFEQRRECEQYYNLFCKVLEDSLSLPGEVKIDFEKVLNQILEELRNHTSTEKRSSSKNDKILIGFLDLIERILKIKPILCQQLGEFGLYLFNICLFSLDPQRLLDEDLIKIKLDESLEVNPHNYVKCKQQQSRKTAYKILNQLFIHNKQFRTQFFSACLIPLFDSLSIPTGWNYKPSTNSRSFLKFAGIKNLGATCYQNSILQQFYMTETFRYLILSMDDKVQENLVPYSGRQKEEVGKPVDDNILHQFQKLFAFLELTDRQFYNPAHFCFSYKDFDGQPVNVIVQQDAQEFLNRIFEKLESGMKNTSLKFVTENIFGGKTSSLLQCNVCGNIKENVELFYNLSLTVQNMKSLQETLDFMIKGETINDYFCETCQKKQDITKKICLSYLPNVLIIHLQRIVFDMDTFENKKINSHFEFPHLLNLEPYTKDGLESKQRQQQEAQNKEQENLEELSEEKLQKKESLKFENSQGRNSQCKHPQEYYSYKLKGIVVHTGTAQQGHYYSYIQYKDKNNAEKWIEFNDMNIQVFDPKNIPKECFGGQQNSQSNNEDWGWSTSATSDKQERSKCAYVLVYERSSTDPLKFQFDTKEDKEIIEDLKIEKSKILEEDDSHLVVDYSGINRSINKKLFSQVWMDNHKYMLEKQIYNEDFFQFILNFVQSIEVPSDYIRKTDCKTWVTIPDIYQNYLQIPEERRQSYIQTLDFLYPVVFQIIARANDNNILKTMLFEIRCLLNLIPDYAFAWVNKFFIGNKKQTIDILLTAADKDVRSIYGQIINYCVNITIQINNLNLNEDSNPILEAESTICAFYLHCVQILNSEVAKNWQKMAQFLEMIRDFVISGDVQINFAFKNEFIARLIDFYLQKESSLPANVYGKKIHQMSNKYQQPDFNSLYQTLAELIPRAYSLNGQPPSIKSIQDYSLEKNEQISLGQMEFYQKMLKDSQVQNIIKIFNHMSRENLEFSREIARFLLLAFNKSNCDEVKPYLQIINSFLTINDSLFLQRAEWLLGVPTIRPNKYDNFYICGNLEDMCIKYESTLDNVNYQQTILQTLYEVRRRYENYTVVSLNLFLQLLDSNEIVLNYLVLMPPPNYIVTRYIDWIKSYLLEFISDAKKYGSYNQSFNKEKLGEETLLIYNSVEQKFNAQMAQILGPQYQNESLFKNYIVGGIIDQKLVSNDVIHEHEGNKVYIYQVEYEVYMVDSKPNGTTNTIFPEEILDKNMLKTYNISQNSNIFNIIHNHEKYQVGTSLYYLKDPIKKDKIEENKIEKKQTPKNSEKKILTLNIVQSDNQIESNQQYESKQIDIDDIYQAPFIRKIGINNETDQTIYINFQIIAENPDDINFLFPISNLKRVIQPKENLIIWFINKRDAEQEWGNYSYNCGFSFKQNQQNIQNNQQDNMSGKKPPVTQESSTQPDVPGINISGVPATSIVNSGTEQGLNKKLLEAIQQEESYASQKAANQNPGVGVYSLEYDPMSFQDDITPALGVGDDKNCQICTFLNPQNALSCTMCGSMF